MNFNCVVLDTCEVEMGACLGEVQRLARRVDGPDQTLAEREACNVDCRLGEALRRVELERTVAEKVDRADLARQPLGDDADDCVELRLRPGLRRHDVVKAAEDFARGGDAHHQAGASTVAPRRDSAVSASSTSSAMISATGASRVTMPTDWPAIRLPVSTSPSTTARRSAPAQ